MITLPSQNKKWIQENDSDLTGNIYYTKNICFDENGYLRLSNSSRAIMNDTVDADFDLPAAFLQYGASADYFIPTWDDAFTVGSNIFRDYPTQMGVSGTPSTDLESDIILSNNQLILTQDTDVDYYDTVGGTWTDTNISLTADGQHPIVNFVSLQAIAIANVYQVKLYATPFTATPTLITTLSIPQDFEITQMAYLNQYLYIGTQNMNGGKSMMYVWNGQGTAAQQAYEMDSSIILSLCVHQGAIWCLNGFGELSRFNGSGFTRKGTFPLFYTDTSLITDVANKPMFKNILKSNGDLIYILFNDSKNRKRQLLNQPDGIWCYDERVGLYHRYSLSNSLVNIQTILTSAVNTTTNQITVSSPAPVTGTEVFYYDDGDTAIGGLTSLTKYFVIKVDSTHVKLATTKVNALAGTAIDLTGTGNNGQSLNFFENIDYGSFLTNRTMALLPIELYTEGKWGSDLLWGGEVNRRTLSGDDSYMGSTSSFVESRGYFVTPKIFSEGINDVYNNLVIKYSTFLSELDKIIIKYRLEDDRLDTIDCSGTNWEATWTSTTTFTTTQTDMANAEVGDEIEFLNGAGGGLLAHITTISENSGTYTVTIDETFDNYITGDKAKFVFRNWSKFATITSSDLGYFSSNIGKNSKFIQFKIELRGIKVRIEDIKLNNKELLPV